MKTNILYKSVIFCAMSTALLYMSQSCQKHYDMVPPPVIQEDDDLDDEIIGTPEDYFVTLYGDGEMDGSSWISVLSPECEVHTSWKSAGSTQKRPPSSATSSRTASFSSMSATEMASASTMMLSLLTRKAMETQYLRPGAMNPAAALPFPFRMSPFSFRYRIKTVITGYSLCHLLSDTRSKN